MKVNSYSERGFALPMVISVLMIVVFISFFATSQLVRHRQSALLYQESIRAQYAAESGIAMMQQRLSENGKQQQPIFHHYQHFYVTTKLQKSDPQWEVQSTAIGRHGVKQTIRVKLDSQSLAIQEWIK